MEKKLRELRQMLTNKISEARNLTEEGKIEEATKITDEAEILKEQIENLEKLAKLENEISDDTTVVEETSTGETKPEARTVLVKALAGKKLTVEERGMLKEGTAVSPDVSGAYIVPEDVKTQINEYKRQYKSMKDFVDVQTTSTVSGSFVYEDGSTMTELSDLTEGEVIPEHTPKFNKKEYKIKDKGALLPITNQLLQDEAGGLLSYVGRWFSRKAIKTENKDIFTILKNGKTAVDVSKISELKKIVNVDLDPELSDGTIFITNQNGFNYLDSLTDSTGRPLLQPDPTDKTKKFFGGYPVEVFSNANLPSVAQDTAPVLVGNFIEALRFMDRDVYELATSKEAGFTKNITYLRAIERYDVVLKDTDSYVYANMSTVLPVEAPAG